MKKFTYMFEEGNAGMKNLLGGKGANLAEMRGLGLPVPNGFTITTEACLDYYEKDETISAELEGQIKDLLSRLEKETNKAFNSTKSPLLVSVRSGARASMPGMLDTVLNLGLNDKVVETLAGLTSNRRFAFDSYRRFIMMFSDVVKGINKDEFECLMDAAKKAKGVEEDNDLDAGDLEKVTRQSLARYKEIMGEDFPQDPYVQLMDAVKAVFRSWNNPRAIYYRQINNIPSDWGTAVNIQEMVFGNLGNNSGSGVAFSRSPATGENRIYGEFLVNAQGEDVVAGVRTPMDWEEMKDWMPDVYEEFRDIAKQLEKHYGDMQDIEFTIEKGKLYLLQTRNGKRTADAALQIAVDMVEEGLIDKRRALMQIESRLLDYLLHPSFDTEALKKAKPIAKGLPASPGAATGGLVFSVEAACEAVNAGKKIILACVETSAEDIEGMNIAEGILTAKGGMTSHAAVVARGMGTCCVSGCSSLRIDKEAKVMEVHGKHYREGDLISLDGSTGCVYDTEIKTVEADLSDVFTTVLSWANDIRKLNVRANADKKEDVVKALELGAGGIGLCRTEHMFFAKDRIFEFRKMILAEDEATRQAQLDKLLAIQQSDFEDIFRILKGYPATIRLLDPPLHEFLPAEREEREELAESMGISLDELQTMMRALREVNPMLGMRGCRLAIVFPEIAEMQTKAIIQAAIAVKKEGIEVNPEIMVPLVSDIKEQAYLRKIIDSVAKKVLAEENVDLAYSVGCMIETPRAALTSGEIALEADFFSYGTNDLTQMGYGLSRDDAGKILDVYYKKEIFETDPTAILDQKGIGRLIRISSAEGREAKPEVHLGICGEHGGEASTIRLCHELNFDYVSCSPYRVPIAILAAAQAQIECPREYMGADLRKWPL